MAQSINGYCMGGAGPACFAPWVYSYLCHGLDGTVITITDVLSPDARAILNQVYAFLSVVDMLCMHQENLVQLQFHDITIANMYIHYHAKLDCSMYMHCAHVLYTFVPLWCVPLIYVHIRSCKKFPPLKISVTCLWKTALTSLKVALLFLRVA